MELDNVAHTLWDSSVAQSTKAAYETGFRTYLSFLLLHGFVLNGVKRVQGCTTKTRLTITADILGQLCAKWRAGFSLHIHIYC